MTRALLLVLLLLGREGLGEAQRPQLLTLEDTVDEALRVSNPLRAARMRAEAAEDLARSARGRLLPALSASELYQHYNFPFVISLGEGPGVVARNINTNTLSVTAQQPVLGLLHRVRDFSSALSSADASRADEAATRAQIAETVRTAYLNHFASKAAVTIAEASIEQLRKQVKDSEARYRAGTINHSDVLRYQTAVANAQLQQIQASTAAKTSRQLLLTLLARSPEDTSVEFVEPADVEVQAGGPLPGSTDELIRHALDARPEVRRASSESDSARANGEARLFELLPEVSFEAQYLNVRGQVFFPESAYYVGVNASWAFWTWGARWYAAQSARRQADAALANREETRRQVAYDVASKAEQLRAQFVAVEVAKTALASAEEAYRVTSAQVAAGTATTTDLLDAQAALTSAKLNLARARYERAIARVLLDRAAAAR